MGNKNKTFKNLQMKFGALLMLAGFASSIQISSKARVNRHYSPLSKAIANAQQNAGAGHFMQGAIDLMAACDMYQHDFKLSWEEAFDCVNNAHVMATYVPGTPLSEAQHDQLTADFEKADADGSGLLDIYELKSFIDAHAEPCAMDYLVDTNGECVVDALGKGISDEMHEG